MNLDALALARLTSTPLAYVFYKAISVLGYIVSLCDDSSFSQAGGVSCTTTSRNLTSIAEASVHFQSPHLLHLLCYK
jgi:hypothetical protein